MIESQNTREERLIFKLFIKKNRKNLVDLFESEILEAIIKNAEECYIDMLEYMPIIDQRAPFHSELRYYSHFLALAKAAEKYGDNVQKIGSLIIKDAQDNINQKTEQEIKDERRKWFSVEKENYKQTALYSQERKYSDDWIYYYIECEDGKYDFGLDFTKCAIWDFFKKMDGQALIPYVCYTDFIWSEGLGLGLKRTKTLVTEDDRCNLRWKNGAATQSCSILTSLVEKENFNDR